MRTLNPTWNFTEQEQQLYESYIDAYLEEYPDLSATDKIQLRDASAFHVHHIRFLNQERPGFNTRFLPKNVELGILNSLGLNRAQRVDTRKTTVGTVKDNFGNEYSESEALDMLVGLQQKVTRK